MTQARASAPSGAALSADWPVSCHADDPFGKRVVSVACSALAAGKLSNALRTAFFRSFIACGGSENLLHLKGTYCAVFAGAVRHWAGRPAHLPRYPASGATSIHSWLATDGFTKASGWLSVDDPACLPEAGAIAYVEADSNAYNNHVVVLVQPVGAGEFCLWLCAEGGGGADGSECKFTVRAWGERGAGFDARRTRGLWLPGRADRVGAPPSAPGVELPSFPITRASPRDDVARWQRRLLTWNRACLPKYGPDGGWGTETETATKALKTAKGIQPNAGTSVDSATWEACKP